MKTVNLPACAAAESQQRHNLFTILAMVMLTLLLSPIMVQAAQAAKAGSTEGSDVLVFMNGNHLTGRFLRSIKGHAVFRSAMAGELTVAWEQIREIRSEAEFVVIRKGVRVTERQADQHLRASRIQVADEQIEMNLRQEGAEETIPLAEVSAIIDRVSYERELRHESNPLAGWKGAATAGATVVAATQKAYTLNWGIKLERTVPTVDWLDKRNRTHVEFQGSYGRITQPGTTAVKSAIYHAGAERDEYFSEHLYALVQTAFDHNYSQGLDLQQIYGGGLGRSFWNDPRQSFDAKATLQYEQQSFLSAAVGSEQHLIGSTLSASYTRKLVRGTALSQQISYIPAWNHLHAYSLMESNTLALPVSRRLSFSLGTIDSYLNNPVETTPATKRNSFQFTMGARFSIP